MESETITRLKNYMESPMSISFLGFMVVILILCLIALLLHSAYKYDDLVEQHRAIKTEYDKLKYQHYLNWSLDNG